MNTAGKIRGKLNREKTGAFLSEMRWLAGYSWKYRLRMVWYALCGLISTGLGLAGSVISKHIIDAVTGADSGGLVLAVAFYVFSQVTSIAMNAAGSRRCFLLRRIGWPGVWIGCCSGGLFCSFCYRKFKCRC